MQADDGLVKFDDGSCVKVHINLNDLVVESCDLSLVVLLLSLIGIDCDFDAFGFALEVLVGSHESGFIGVDQVYFVVKGHIICI